LPEFCDVVHGEFKLVGRGVAIGLRHEICSIRRRFNELAKTSFFDADQAIDAKQKSLAQNGYTKFQQDAEQDDQPAG